MACRKFTKIGAGKRILGPELPPPCQWLPHWTVCYPEGIRDLPRESSPIPHTLFLQIRLKTHLWLAFHDRSFCPSFPSKSTFSHFPKERNTLNVPHGGSGAATQGGKGERLELPGTGSLS